MTTKQDILAGIRDVAQRFDRLLPGIVANLEKPLPEGSWTVHDALCHLAADANAVPRWLARIEAAAQGKTTRPPGFNLDQFNQQNIDARKHRPVDVVVDEVRGGLKADRDAVEGLDEEALQQQLPNFRGELGPASEMLSFTTIRHNHMHLDDIEKALA